MKIACSFLDFLNEKTNVGRNKYSSNCQLVRSVQLHYLSHVVTNFTYEIEVSTTSIKIQLGVYYEMMVQLVVLYSFFYTVATCTRFKKAFLEYLENQNQNHGLTPLEKYQNFDFFNFVILESKTLFSFLEYRQKRFPGLFSLQ